MKKIIFLLLGASFTFSCKKNEKADVLVTENKVTDTATVAAPNATSSVTTSPTVNPVATPAPIVQNTVASAPTNTPTAPGMNPPHGQPNHRCDIPVGAPLSTPAPKTPSVQSQVLPQNNIQVQPANPTPAPAATVATAPGMNPPHGEPNHRCDIPVGAPLNSK